MPSCLPAGEGTERIEAYLQQRFPITKYCEWIAIAPDIKGRCKRVRYR